ncbi:MAG: hypothetical protein ACI94Y_002893 [Maribacter sp.]|jgi:hypothetical protein
MNTSITKTILFLLFTLLSTLSYGQTFDWETATLNSSPGYPNLSASQVINGTYHATFRMPNLGPINLTNAGQGTSGLSVRNSQPQPTTLMLFYPALNIQSVQVYAMTNNQNWVFKSIDDNGNVLNTTTATVDINLSTVALNWTNVTKIEISKAEGWSGNYGVDDIVFTPYIAPCNVNIPDANFKNYLIGNSSINTNGDAEIQCSEAAAVTSLDIESLNIADATGLNAFTNLALLYAGSNQLTTIDLSGMNSLASLYLEYNQLTSIDLSGLSALQAVYLLNNQLSSINLNGTTNLENLQISDNQLSSLDLSQSSQLEYINFSDNQLISIDFSNNNNLLGVVCYRNLLTSLDVSSNLQLQGLLCAENQITSLDLSNNINFNGNLRANDNNLTSLNVANGNNPNIALFIAMNNLNLTCITVDDVAYSTANWTSIDPQTSFSTGCNIPEPTVEMTDATTALFSWAAIPNATSYQVKYRLKNTTSWSTSGTTTTQRNVPNLTAKKYYQYKVRCQFTNGSWSDFSAVELFYTSACDVPTGVASIYLDNTRMRIRWDNNPSEIKAKVRYREVGTSTWYTQNSGDGNNYIYINNLTPNAEYQYRVRSNCDGNDWSEYSASYFHDLNSVQRIAAESVSETKIYPNPARDVLFVAFDNKNAEQVNSTITDGLGKTIQSSMNNSNNGTQQIDISRIPNGYYFISIQKENSVETLKFLKVN